MLSQEIYNSWNAKSTADLKELLDKVNGPKIPKEVKSTTFKKAVLQKIEKRRLADSKKRDSKDLDHLHHDEEHGCCSCLCISRNAVHKLKYYECKTMTSFDKMCAAATECFNKSIASVKALNQKLSYWASIKRGMDGLSVIGGDMWLLSYACQHLIDSPQTKDQYSMHAHLAEIKATYQELGQAGELFLDLTQTFHNDTHMMRSDALLILKKLAKRWSIEVQNNPLNIRPESIKQIPHPRKRLGSGLDRPYDQEDDDEVFAVKWSPLTVCIQLHSTDSPKPFGRLHPQDRTTIFRKFLRSTLDKVEMAAEDLTIVSQQLSAAEVDPDLHLVCRQITLSMSGFSKSKYAPKILTKSEQDRMILLLNEFWYSIDVLHENAYVLLRLVEETRDIIRTCYVYVDIFYKWRMPSYDAFISKTVWNNGKDFLHRLHVNTSAKKLSEAQSILQLMDFSSSIYQGVVQEVPVTCEGMILRLRMHDLDMSDEPMGLISGIVDKRKSSVRLADLRMINQNKKA